MKKRNIYIIASVFFALSLALIVLFFVTGRDKQQIEGADTNRVSAEEYLLMNSLEKAAEAEDLIFLTEEKDCSFVYGNTQLKKVAKEIGESFFDGLIVKSTALSSVSTTSLSDSERDKLLKICEYFIEKDKTAYVYCTAYLAQENIMSLCEFSSGVVIDLQSVGADKKDKLVSKLTNIKKKLGTKKLIIMASDGNELYKELDKKLYDCLFVNFNDEADVGRLKELQLEFFSSGTTVAPLTDFSLYGQSKHGVEALRAYYDIKDCQEIEMRAFTSYSDAKNNNDNCYSAIKTYIVRGIAPILAFRELGIKNYSAESEIKSTESVCKAELNASYLFPIYVNGKSVGTLPKSTGEISLDLVRGENTFTIEQNGKSVSYTVDYEFEGDIVKSVAPSDNIRVSAGEEIAVMVVAYSEAEVYVKLGATKYKAEKQGEETGYTAFYARIRMPDNMAELSSLDKISVVATLGNETQIFEGAEIVPVVLENSPVFSTLAQYSSSLGVNNFNPTYIDVQQQVAPSLSAAISKAATNSYSQEYTGNQTAVVTAEHTDALPSGGNEAFVPYYTTLAKGTKDFIIGESQVFDSDENEWFYYYDLACGVKVSRDSVSLEPSQTMPENALRVNSVYGNNGELTIRLSNVWKVPYTMELINQSYYSNNSYSYYVSDFTASAIALTFHYTTSATGEIDCSYSDVVSAATWSVSAQDKKATLYLPLRETGAYYGYSLNYEGDEMVITINNRFKGLAGSVVVLDPGHGAGDAGATGLAGQVRESDINILVAYKVKAALEQQGVTVYMTRYADDDISLTGRKIFARSVKPDLYVSIHSDASSNKETIGTSAFYYKAFSMNLAQNIHNEIVSVYKNNIYAGRQDLYGNISRGVKYYPFSVTRLDECPSVLIELGFMSNDNECYQLTMDSNQQLLGQAIARGICTTLTTQ